MVFTEQVLLLLFCCFRIGKRFFQELSPNVRELLFLGIQVMCVVMQAVVNFVPGVVGVKVNYVFLANSIIQ